jgi:hypothetical protein
MGLPVFPSDDVRLWALVAVVCLRFSGRYAILCIVGDRAWVSGVRIVTRRSLLSLLPAAGALPDGCWIALAYFGAAYLDPSLCRNQAQREAIEVLSKPKRKKARKVREAA